MFKLNSVEILCVVLGINPRALHGAFSPLLMKYFKSVVVFQMITITIFSKKLHKGNVCYSEILSLYITYVCTQK